MGVMAAYVGVVCRGGGCGKSSVDSGSGGTGIHVGCVSSGGVLIFVTVVEAPPLNCEDSGWCSCKPKEVKGLKNEIEAQELQVVVAIRRDSKHDCEKEAVL